MFIFLSLLYKIKLLNHSIRKPDYPLLTLSRPLLDQLRPLPIEIKMKASSRVTPDRYSFRARGHRHPEWA
jgi:hypothetical protein